MNKIDPRYTRRLVPDEDGGYTATIHEFPGCVAEGDTAEEALKNLENSASDWIDAAHEAGYKISPPVDFEGASGKIALRISRRIHQQASERAALEGTSLNQLISVAVATYLGQQDGVERAVEVARKQLSQSLANLQNGPIIFIVSENTQASTKQINEEIYWESSYQRHIEIASHNTPALLVNS